MLTPFSFPSDDTFLFNNFINFFVHGAHLGLGGRFKGRTQHARATNGPSTVIQFLLPVLIDIRHLYSLVQTAYRETGVSNRSNSFTKIIYTGAYMILDAQNLHTCSQSRQTPGLQPYKCQF